MTAERMRALVVVLVPANDQVDTVLIKERHPLFANAEVCSVGQVRGGDRDLVHADDHPIDTAVIARSRELPLEPCLLGSGRVSADVRVAAVLVGDVVVGDADDPHGTGREGVPKTARDLRLSGGLWQREVGLIRLIADRAIAELVLMIARRWHPGTVACAARVVLPEVPPRA